jgi:hypothetical protein
MPSDAAGPVADMVTPTLTCAIALAESESAAAAKATPGKNLTGSSSF